MGNAFKYFCPTLQMLKKCLCVGGVVEGVLSQAHGSLSLKGEGLAPVPPLLPIFLSFLLTSACSPPALICADFSAGQVLHQVNSIHRLRKKVDCFSSDLVS